MSSQLGAGYWLLITHRFEIGTVPTIWRSECSSLVAHLSTVAESRVRIPAPCKYCKTASACSSSSYSYSCSSSSGSSISSSSRRISKKKGRTKKLINWGILTTGLYSASALSAPIFCSLEVLIRIFGNVLQNPLISWALLLDSFSKILAAGL